MNLPTLSMLRCKIHFTNWSRPAACGAPRLVACSCIRPRSSPLIAFNLLLGARRTPSLWRSTLEHCKSRLTNFRPPLSCSTACSMNNSAVSSPDSNPFAWATAATPCWPTFSDWMLTPLRAGASNCSTATLPAPVASEKKAADGLRRKKNARTNRCPPEPSRTRHSGRSHHRAPLVPPHQCQDRRSSHWLRLLHFTQYGLPPSARHGLLSARQQQTTGHRFQSRSQSPVRLHRRPPRSLSPPPYAHH